MVISVIAALGGQVSGLTETWGQLGPHGEFEVVLSYVHRETLSQNAFFEK